MLGVYDYTVILTYLSAISGVLGIVVSLNGTGHPYMGVFFLMFCGLCDAFDGKVARSKKGRTETEQKFGIQIDSMSDLIAFGVLPACIGNAMIKVSPTIQEIPRIHREDFTWPMVLLLWTIILLYVVSALIRLSFFNVAEEERIKKDNSPRKFFTGVPVTTAALLFPNILLIQFITETDITLIYFIGMVVLGFAFLSKFPIPKPQKMGLIIMILIGVVDFILLGISFATRYGIHLW